MRVLFISPQPFFQWRGSPIRVAFDLLALAEQGYEVDFLTLPVGADKEIEGVRTIRVPNLFGVRSVPIGPSAVKAAFDVLLLFKGLWLAFRRRYDVVHGVEDAGFIGLIIAGLTRCKLVFEKHSDPHSYKKRFLRNAAMTAYAAVECFTARRADAVIGTGPGLATQVRAMNVGGQVYEICDIPSSLAVADPDQVARLRTSLRKRDAEVLITYVGSFAVYQGVDLLFEVVPPVVAENPNARFVIIGGTPDEIRERRRRLADGNVEQAVSFLGKIPPDELPAYLAASDILLSPRIAGANTPLKILDYFKAGRAIVATDVEANRFLLDDDTAVLVRPEPKALAGGIGRAIGDRELRERLAENGRKQIDTKYNFKEFSRLLGECYRNLSGLCA